MRRSSPILSRRLVTIVLLTVSIFATYGISRMEMVQDITALVPGKPGTSISLTDLARSSGLMKKVIVLLGPSDLPMEVRGSAMDIVAESISKLDGVAKVVSRVDEGQVRKAAEAIMSRASMLRGPTPEKLDKTEIQNRLARLKKDLSTAQAMITGPYLLKDPLGFSRNALSGLEAAAQSMGTLEGGRLVSKDGRYILAVVNINFDPMDVSRSKDFVINLDKSIKDSIGKSNAPSLVATHLGGVHFAASSAKAIMSDVQLAFLLTAILVIAVFLYFFRSIRLLPAALLPGGVGIAVAAAVMGILGIPLHALTLGFAATITGISVDYAIHLLKRATHETKDTSLCSMTIALRTTARPIVLGCLTTFGAFVLIATSGFTGVRQLAIFASISIPVAMLVTLLALPAFHSFLLRKETRVETTGLYVLVSRRVTGNLSLNGRLTTCIVFGLVLMGSVLGATRMSMSGDPRDLRNKDQELEAKEHLVRKVFPGLADHALLVASGETIEGALQKNDELYKRLIENGVEKQQIVSVSPFLPSQNTQQKSLGSVKSLWDGNDSTPPLAQMFTLSGFKSGYVSNLKKDLESAPLTLETFQNTGIEQIIADSIINFGGANRVITRVIAKDEASIEKLKAITNSLDDCQLVSERIEIENALNLLQKELVWMLAVWLGAALLVLALVERSPLFALRASLPAIFGVTAAVALFGFTGRPLTPVASAGVTLVMGLGIDYGIFMQSEKRESLGPVAFAVLASSLTTIAGFGVLSIAQTRAMADIGLIVLVGVTTALATAIWLLPALASTGYKRQS